MHAIVSNPSNYQRGGGTSKSGTPRRRIEKLHLSLQHPKNTMSKATKTPIESDIEDDLPHATDDEGNIITEEDVIGAAERIEALTFRVLGQNHTVFVSAIQVPARLNNRLRAVGTRLFIKAGFCPGEQPFSTEMPADAESPEGVEGNEAERAQLPATELSQDDERLSRLIMLTEESQEVRAIHADIAVAAIVRNKQGLCRVSIPQFQRDLTAQKLLHSGALGDALISTVWGYIAPL